MTSSEDHRARRHFLTFLGTLSLALGAIGILVPPLPTAPFLILAAYCFSQGRAECPTDWLTGHQVFGPPIRD